MYLDTSTLFAFYIQEEKSSIVDNAIKSADQVSVSNLTDVEFLSALKKRNRIGHISLGDVQETYLQYQTHRKAGMYNWIKIGELDFKSAEVLLNKTSTSLRTLDALHLGIVENHSLKLFTFDNLLIDVALEFNLGLINPNDFSVKHFS